MASGVILTNTDYYQSIRRAIDTTLDDGVTTDDDRIVTNAAIEDPFILDASEAEIIGLFPDAATPETLPLVDQKRLIRVVILLAASRLAPRVPILVSERRREHQYQLLREDAQTISDRLRGEALSELDPLLPEEDQAIGASRFTAVGRRRA